MTLIQLLRFGKGYVSFSAQGNSVERFLNLAARDNIPLWNARRQEGNFTGCTTARQYCRFRPLARRTHTRVRIIRRHGIPFQLRRYRHRVGWLGGLLLFCAVMVFSGNFIWDIQVSGNHQVHTSDILAVLEQNGLHRGLPKQQVDVERLAKQLTIGLDELSWAAVNLIGTVAHVEVEERVAAPHMVDSGKPCNIIAAKGGQIVSMEVYQGQKVLPVKSAVKKGDLIVSGIVEAKDGTTMVRHAQAKVIAQYSETQTFFYPFTQTKKVPSGGVLNYKFLRWGDKNIPLFLGKGYRGESYERQYTRPARMLGLPLPFDLLVRQVIPAKQQEITVSEQKARQMAIAQMIQYENAIQRTREIVSKKTNGNNTREGYEITAHYIFQENIAEESEIFIEKQHNS